MAASTQASVPPPVSGYFMDSKKGEVNELKEVSMLLFCFCLLFCSNILFIVVSSSIIALEESQC